MRESVPVSFVVCTSTPPPGLLNITTRTKWLITTPLPPLLRGNNEFIQRRSLATESPNAVGAVWNLEAGRGESEECTAKFDALSQQALRRESEQFQKQKTKAGLQRDLPYCSIVDLELCRYDIGFAGQLRGFGKARIESGDEVFSIFQPDGDTH